MAELLIKAEDAPVPDSPDKWYAARILRVEDDGFEWSPSEGPPIFYLLKVPGVAKEDAQQYLEEWRHNTSIGIVAQDLASDGYRLRLISDRVSASGKNALVRERVEEFFTNWGATIVSFQNDRITFDLTVFNAITSPRFWGVDVSGVVFVETSYNESTGDHLVQVQESPFSNDQMRDAVVRNGGMVVPPDSFVMNRSVAREKLVDDINEQIFNIAYDLRRWYVTATGMSALQAAGGVLTVTPQQFLNNIADGLSD